MLQEHLTAPSTWIRGLYILLFVVLFWLARIVVGAVTVVQFLFVLFSGEREVRLSRLGAQLAAYTNEIFRYQTFASDVRPFPFKDWPQAEPDDDEEVQAEVVEPESESAEEVVGEIIDPEDAAAGVDADTPPKQRTRRKPATPPTEEG